MAIIPMSVPSMDPERGQPRSWRLTVLSLLVLVSIVTAGPPTPGSFFDPKKPITLKSSGGFAVGGSMIINPANTTQTLSCDHGYVEYFMPWTPRKTSLVMWHSSSAQVWQNRWDGGPGYKDMFLQRDYPVFLWDGPRVGRANWPCVATTYAPGYRDQENFVGWNFGPAWKQFWNDSQGPTQDDAAWNQATRARYDETDSWDNVQLQSDAAAVALDSGRLGDRVVYLTNSAGGYRAQVAVAKAQGGNAAGIVAYESIGYVFPTDIDPALNITENLGTGFGPRLVSPADFKKLAELEFVQFIWGSHKAQNTTFVRYSYLCAQEINRYGGNAKVVMVEIDLGLKGASHIMFADMNNAVHAGLLENALKQNKLDKYEKGWWQKFFSW
jgi:hypothetical protein